MRRYDLGDLDVACVVIRHVILHTDPLHDVILLLGRLIGRGVGSGVPVEHSWDRPPGKAQQRHVLLDIVFMETVGMRPIIEHVGGKAIEKLLDRLVAPAQRVVFGIGDGRRIVLVITPVMRGDFRRIDPARSHIVLVEAAARQLFAAQYQIDREIARGELIGDTVGMLKLLFHSDTRELLGVHIIGEGATELVHIGQAVMALGGKLDYFIDAVFNYPTLAECYKVAALAALNRFPAIACAPAV